MLVKKKECVREIEMREKHGIPEIHWKNREGKLRKRSHICEGKNKEKKKDIRYRIPRNRKI